MFVIVVISEAIVEFFNISVILLIAILIYVVKKGNLIKVLLHFAYHVRNEGRFHLLAFKTAPLEFTEKSMLFDLTSAWVSKSFGWIFDEKTVDKIC